MKFDAHSSTDGIAYYADGGFPPEHTDSLFVAQWGNNEGRPESGQKVMRVPVTSAKLASSRGGGGTPKAEVFASGFSHPLAATVDSAGALYVADYGRGTIYRISWAGDG